MVFTRNGSTLLASAGLHPDRLEELTDLEYSDEEGIQFDGARNAEGKKIDWIDLVEGELSDLTEAEDEAERPSCVEVASQRVSSRKNARSQEKKTRFQPSRRAAIQNPSEEDNIAYATVDQSAVADVYLGSVSTGFFNMTPGRRRRLPSEHKVTASTPLLPSAEAPQPKTKRQLRPNAPHFVSQVESERPSKRRRVSETNVAGSPSIMSARVLRSHPKRELATLELSSLSQAPERLILRLKRQSPSANVAPHSEHRAGTRRRKGSRTAPSRSTEAIVKRESELAYSELDKQPLVAVEHEDEPRPKRKKREKGLTTRSFKRLKQESPGATHHTAILGADGGDTCQVPITTSDEDVNVVPQHDTLMTFEAPEQGIMVSEAEPMSVDTAPSITTRLPPPATLLGSSDIDDGPGDHMLSTAIVLSSSHTPTPNAVPASTISYAWPRLDEDHLPRSHLLSAPTVLLDDDNDTISSDEEDISLAHVLDIQRVELEMKIELCHVELRDLKRKRERKAEKARAVVEESGMVDQPRWKRGRPSGKKVGVVGVMARAVVEEANGSAVQPKHRRGRPSGKKAALAGAGSVSATRPSVSGVGNSTSGTRMLAKSKRVRKAARAEHLLAPGEVLWELGTTSSSSTSYTPLDSDAHSTPSHPPDRTTTKPRIWCQKRDELLYLLPQLASLNGIICEDPIDELEDARMVLLDPGMCEAFRFEAGDRVKFSVTRTFRSRVKEEDSVAPVIGHQRAPPFDMSKLLSLMPDERIEYLSSTPEAIEPSPMRLDSGPQQMVSPATYDPSASLHTPPSTSSTLIGTPSLLPSTPASTPRVGCVEVADLSHTLPVDIDIFTRATKSEEDLLFNVVANRNAFHAALGCAVEEEKAFIWMGIMNVVSVEPTMLRQTRDSPTSQLVRGAVRWDVELQWVSGGEHLIPGLDDESTPDDSLEDTELSSSPWWHSVIPSADNITAQSSNSELYKKSSFYRYAQILPPYLLASHGKDKVSPKLPRGWLCLEQGCGRLNVASAFRHRRCLSQTCRKKQADAFVVSLLETRGYHADVYMSSPLNSAPSSWDYGIDHWTNGMSTTWYSWGVASQLEGEATMVRLGAKHIFTKNSSKHQGEQTELLRLVQEQVVMENGGISKPGHSFHAFFGIEPSGRPAGYKHDVIPLDRAGACVHCVRDFLETQCAIFGDLSSAAVGDQGDIEEAMALKPLRIEALAFLGSDQSGKAKLPQLYISSGDRPLVVMCLGSQLTFTVTFKRAFEIEGEVFEAKSIEVVDGSAASLDDCPLAAQDAGSANEITDADRSSSKDGVPAIIAEQLPPSDPTSSTFTPHCNYTSSEAAPVSPGLPLPHQGSVPVGLSAKKVEAPAIADEGAASRRDGNSSAGGDQSVVRKETCKFTLVHGDVLMLFGSELELHLERSGSGICIVASALVN